MKFGLNEATLEAIMTVLAAHPQLEAAIIYGSRAKGNYKPGSDIDLTLQGANLTLAIVHQIELELDELLLPYTFDLSLYHHLSNPDLLAHIERVGQLFYPPPGE